jgi:hypothetical protein
VEIVYFFLVYVIGSCNGDGGCNLGGKIISFCKLALKYSYLCHSLVEATAALLVFEGQFQLQQHCSSRRNDGIYTFKGKFILFFCLQFNKSVIRFIHQNDKF